MAALVFLVVPLYLWRRPAGIEGAVPEDLVAEADANLVLDIEPPAVEEPPRIKLGEPRTLRCIDESGARLPGERCDRLPFFEEALMQAIHENVDCAPVSLSESTVNFVLTVDFAEESLHLWPGQSGSLRRPQANELLRCVLRDIDKPDFSAFPHRFQRYELSVMATYPP